MGIQAAVRRRRRKRRRTDGDTDDHTDHNADDYTDNSLVDASNEQPDGNREQRRSCNVEQLRTDVLGLVV